MAPEDTDAVGALLEKALALPSGARAAFLDDACNGDNDLCEELTSLLLAHDGASDYFKRAAEVIRPALVVLADAAGDEFSIGQTIAHYRLIEKLGAGGMGVVFRALDLRLDRSVALKFLPAHLSKNTTAKERLIAEAKAASALDHPNIGVVHDIAETNEGCLFIVMAYYEGETLDRKNQRGGVSIGDAVDLATQIASALTAAHEKGIIHRDVKPSNILVTKDGTAKLLDFGIAKLANSEPGQERSIPGTVGYMSPEQIRGGTVDHRTDLWSLGIVLYESITGARPFRSNSHEALLCASGQDVSEPVIPGKGKIPEGISRILGRCLAEDPAGRYAELRQLLTDLRAHTAGESLALKRTVNRSRRSRLAVYGSIAAVGVMAGAAIYVERRSGQIAVFQRTAPLQSHRHQLAILPFINVDSSAEGDYLADGMTAELITQFSKISEFRVIARSSVMRYHGSGKTAIEIGQELAVGALLAGRLRKTVDQLQLTLRLVDAKTDDELWTRDYTASIDDLESIQRDIVLRVAEALDVGVQSSEQRNLTHVGTSSADAYLLYLKGRHSLEKRNVDAAKQAKEYFEQALDLDPAFAKAWAGVGETFSVLSALATVRAADAYVRSKAAAERALQIDPDLAEAHVCLANALSSYYWDFESAAHHYRRALELSPSYADAHRLHAEHLRFEGRFDEALREARQAEELDPLSSAPQIVAGTILYWARRYDEGIAEFRRILDVNPHFSYAYFFLALTLIQKHDYEKALEALNTPGAGSPLQQETLRAYIHGVTARQTQARQALDKLQRLSREKGISPWHSAIIHVGLGEHNRAIDLLEEAYRARDWQLRMLPHEPLFDALRSHPRFQTLVNKMQ